MDKDRALRRIAGEIKRCSECRRNKSGLPVPGEGNPDARIMLVGEAPGPEESKTGRPFVGRSGKFLDRMLGLIGIERGDVFITSPVKYYPGRRAPTKEEVEHGSIHLKKQVEVISPEIVVLLGNVAVKAAFPEEKISLKKMHGKKIESRGRIYFVTFHPSAAMRFPEIRKFMEEDFRKLKRIKE